MIKARPIPDSKGIEHQSSVKFHLCMIKGMSLFFTWRMGTAEAGEGHEQAYDGGSDHAE
jgi:hypothetical protein